MGAVVGLQFTHDLDRTTVLACRILKNALVSLIYSGDNIVEGKFYGPDKFLIFIWLCIVIHIIYLSQKCLLLLKIVIDLEAFHETRVQAVSDRLSPPNFLAEGLVAPLLHLIDNAEGIRLGERIEIRQVFAGDR